MQLIATFSALLTMVEFSFESEDAVEQALAHFENGNADLGEYLHLAISRKNQALPFWTGHGDLTPFMPTHRPIHMREHIS